MVLELLVTGKYLSDAEITNEGRPDTRGHSLKLEKPRHGTTKRNMFFSARIINEWNNLPEEVINSRSINTFKNRFDRHVQNVTIRVTSYEL